MWTGPRWRWCGLASGSSFASQLWFECCGLFPVETLLRPTKLIKLQLPPIHQLLTNPSPSPGCEAWLCSVPPPTATPYSDICEAFYKVQRLAACGLLPMPCCWCSQASPFPPSPFSPPSPGAVRWWGWLLLHPALQRGSGPEELPASAHRQLCWVHA